MSSIFKPGIRPNQSIKLEPSKVESEIKQPSMPEFRADIPKPLSFQKVQPRPRLFAEHHKIPPRPRFSEKKSVPSEESSNNIVQESDEFERSANDFKPLSFKEKFQAGQPQRDKQSRSEISGVKRPTRKKRAIFASTPRTGTTKLAEMKAIPFIRANLPAGASVDLDGNLTGTSLITKFPATHRKDTPEDNGISVQSFCNIDAVLNLNDEQVVIGGYEFHHSVSDTFHEMSVEISFDEQATTFHSQNGYLASQDPQARSKATATALVAFAGKPETAFVLSSVLGESMLKTLTSSLSSDHLRLIDPSNSKGRQLTLINNDGSRQEISGRYSAEFKLSYCGEPFYEPFDLDKKDYKLTVKLQAYYDLQRDPDGKPVKGLPLGENDVVGVDFYTEFIIDGDKARSGRIAFTTEGIETTFSGRLDMSLI